jgi:lysine-ketoglutarate reductase/saccharopine dehydrogenase-like protein (TIGR00300 family)
MADGRNAAPVQLPFRMTGHLIDRGLMKEILAAVVREGGDYDVRRFDVGATRDDPSVLEAVFTAPDDEAAHRIALALTDLGAEVRSTAEVRVEPAPADGVAPTDFYTTTNHATTIHYRGEDVPVDRIRMDGALVVREENGTLSAECVKQRDLGRGDLVVVGSDGIKVDTTFMEARGREGGEFGFMTGDVSSERTVRIVVDRVAEMMRDRSRKVVLVTGPVMVHTGGVDGFCRLVERGHIHGVLSGNALAVHDIESRLYGTSLGVDVRTGAAVDGGHSHHLRAINEVRRAGSIARLVEEGTLRGGVMHALVTHDVPFVLAGSVRDDGPLPETVTDMNVAQEAYGELLRDADVCLMMASMLHSIAVGNMLPARVLTVCVDIHPAVVTKLKDRGTHQAIGVVTDVGLFLHLLADRLCGPASDAGS